MTIADAEADLPPGTAPGPAPAKARPTGAFGGARRVPAIITAAVVTAVAALAAIEITSRLLAHRVAVLPAPQLARFARDTHFDAIPALAIAAALAAAGLALLVCALWPSRGRVVALYGTDATTECAIASSGLRRDLARAAERVDGITSAKVTMSHSRVLVRAVSAFRDTHGLSEEVQRVAAARIAAFQPVRGRAVHVKIRQAKD